MVVTVGIRAQTVNRIWVLWVYEFGVGFPIITHKLMVCDFFFFFEKLKEICVLNFMIRQWSVALDLYGIVRVIFVEEGWRFGIHEALVC